MSRKNRYRDAKVGREPGKFVALPSVVIRGEGFARLSAHAVKLLIDLLAEYQGDNNGDLSAAWKLMKPRGWRSRDTLTRAISELLDSGFILKSRQGGNHRPSLYAVSFFKVDYCAGKLDVQSTYTPPGTWAKYEPTPALKIKIQHGRRVDSPSIDTAGVSIIDQTARNDTAGVSVRPLSGTETTRPACPSIDLPSPVVGETLPPEPETGDPGPWVADI